MRSAKTPFLKGTIVKTKHGDSWVVEKDEDLKEGICILKNGISKTVQRRDIYEITAFNHDKCTNCIERIISSFSIY